jgi:hypothetical protein
VQFELPSTRMHFTPTTTARLLPSPHPPFPPSSTTPATTTIAVACGGVVRVGEDVEEGLLRLKQGGVVRVFVEELVLDVGEGLLEYS